MTDKADDLPQFAPEFAPRWPGDIDGYRVDQLIAYAAAQVAKERERVQEKLMALHKVANGRHNYYHCAAMILQVE